MTSRSMRRTFTPICQFVLLLFIALLGSGCSTIAEVAYDAELDRDRDKCEREFSMPDRTECINRVERNERQADAIRDRE